MRAHCVITISGTYERGANQASHQENLLGSGLARALLGIAPPVMSPVRAQEVDLGVMTHTRKSGRMRSAHVGDRPSAEMDDNAGASSI